MSIEAPKQNQYEWSKEDLKSIAKEQGLIFNIPEEGSIAFGRLISACRNYTEACENSTSGLVKMEDDIASQFSSEHEYYQKKKEKSNAYKGRVIAESDEGRRNAHDKLCIMIGGKSWTETTPSMRERIALFALSVFEREDLMNASNF